jgi:beta-glucuronidase
MNFFRIFLAAAFLFSSVSFSYAKSVEEKNLEISLKNARKYNKKACYKAPKPFLIEEPGTEKWIDYEKYGEFQNLDSAKYKYAVNDSAGLRAASGEGIFPNSQSVLNSKQYQKYLEENKLEGNKWNFVNSPDLQANFYKWASVREDPGVKLYFTALALDKAGNYAHAVKAYYACLVFFPKSVGYTQWQTPWYIGPVCISRIKFLTRRHPDLGVKLVGAKVKIENSFDNDVRNDVFYVNPGKLVAAKSVDFKRRHIEPSGIKKVSGEGKVKLIEYENGRFRIMVDGKPFVVKGITYSPNKIGLSPVRNNLKNNRDWSWDDYNKNGRIDGPFDSWVDANRNEKQDKNEKPVGDFALLKAMGANTLRVWHHDGLNKEVLKEGYEKYGFMYVIGDFLGMYAMGSQASWEEGTDYLNAKHRENMILSVRKMIEEYKDEPYVLMWVLGNENNYGGAANADKQPKAFYKFANECAKLIKALDPQKRPVAINNGDTLYLDICAQNAPDIDVFGLNSYRGEQGFGNVWQDVADIYKKPVLITEYGCPAYAAGWDTARIEEGQASYHEGYWRDIEDNLAQSEGGAGNALGGLVFEWSDEWWKGEGNTDPWVHDETPQMGGAFLDGNGYEEWYGLAALGDGKDSAFKRQLRKAYFMYREIWK